MGLQRSPAPTLQMPSMSPSKISGPPLMLSAPRKFQSRKVLLLVLLILVRYFHWREVGFINA